MSKKIVSWNYKNLKPMYLGFSSSSSPVAATIRAFTGGIKNMFNRRIPNHFFWITEDCTQFFATEETFGGLKSNSLEKYTKKNNTVLEVYRWVGWSPEEINQAQIYLAEIRRKAKENSKYDFEGLFDHTGILKTLFPWVKNDPEKEYCSENGFSVLKKFGLDRYPKRWDTTPPNPNELLLHIRTRVDFKLCFDAVSLV